MLSLGSKTTNISALVTSTHLILGKTFPFGMTGFILRDQVAIKVKSIPGSPLGEIPRANNCLCEEWGRILKNVRSNVIPRVGTVTLGNCSELL